MPELGNNCLHYIKENKENGSIRDTSIYNKTTSFVLFIVMLSLCFAGLSSITPMCCQHETKYSLQLKRLYALLPLSLILHYDLQCMLLTGLHPIARYLNFFDNVLKTCDPTLRLSYIIHAICMRQTTEICSHEHLPRLSELFVYL